MSQELIKVFDYIAEKTGVVIDYTQENIIPQIMDILGRYRTYIIVSESLLLIVFAIISIISAVILAKIYKEYRLTKTCTKEQLSERKASFKFFDVYEGYYGIRSFNKFNIIKQMLTTL